MRCLAALCFSLQALSCTYSVPDVQSRDASVRDATPTEAGEERAGEAGCLPESDPVFCRSHDAGCGMLSGLDHCGAQRTANCGGCLGGASCDPQTLQCVGGVTCCNDCAAINSYTQCVGFAEGGMGGEVFSSCMDGGACVPGLCGAGTGTGGCSCCEFQ